MKDAKTSWARSAVYLVIAALLTLVVLWLGNGTVDNLVGWGVMAVYVVWVVVRVVRRRRARMRSDVSHGVRRAPSPSEER